MCSVERLRCGLNHQALSAARVPKNPCAMYFIGGTAAAGALPVIANGELGCLEVPLLTLAEQLHGSWEEFENGIRA